MYSIYAANGLFTLQVYHNHFQAYEAFRRSKLMGTAFIVDEDTGEVVYYLVSDGNECSCYEYKVNSSPTRATAVLSA